MNRLFGLLLATALLLPSSSVWAQPAGDGGATGATSFQAADAVPALVPADASDPAALLANCDAEFQRCEQVRKRLDKDKTGIDFLAAAYLALWVILLVFFIMNRARQRRLVVEIRELRARLARLTDAPND